MSGWDLAVVLVYLAATCALGARAARVPNDRTEDYLVAGRKLSLPAFVVTLVATWYGGVLGVGEYSYAHGLSNWLVFGVPYYLGALLFALLFARRARRSADYTLPDLLYQTYGPAAGAVGTLTVFALTLPAAYLLMLGVLLRRAAGISQTWAIICSGAFCLIYIALRGFRGVVQTKGLQFTLMYGGFLLLLPLSAWKSGGWSFLKTNLPAEHFTWSGGMTSGYVLAWYVIALQTLVEPTFYQRCFAARSEKLAKVGILVAIFWFALFDGLTTFTGMYSRALLPSLPSGVEAFPALGEKLLPPVLLGLFYAGMLATIMSTVDSYLFVGGVTLGRDFLWRVSRGRVDQLLWTRIGLLITTATSVAIAVASESVVNLWYGFGSVGTAVLLPPLIGVFYPKLRTSRSFVAPGMVLAGGVALAGLLTKTFRGTPWLEVEPIYSGLATGVAIHILGFIHRRIQEPPLSSTAS